MIGAVAGLGPRVRMAAVLVRMEPVLVRIEPVLVRTAPVVGEGRTSAVCVCRESVSGTADSISLRRDALESIRRGLPCYRNLDVLRHPILTGEAGSGIAGSAARID